MKILLRKRAIRIHNVIKLVMVVFMMQITPRNIVAVIRIVVMAQLSQQLLPLFLLLLPFVSFVAFSRIYYSNNYQLICIFQIEIH
ncbi:hypothetical protein WUBG_17538 [Wuchereria bancrofti]|uniref:Uncharacterized protein n=1 Tax=Wuchereria bancrofti TaxID=6293 RepID=J9DPM5_WUCBA|nr:hypothetical protein WUBG_17538 [Wuchereria bancrofti]